ncbi:MAG: hypothetical protein ABDH28_01895 [Brevinematia bacterium]
MLHEELEGKVVELLARVYNRIDFKKIRTSKNIHDVFNHRVRAASRRESLGEFISKLCNYFGIQSLPQEVLPLIAYLEPYSKIVLSALYTEHIPLCLKAIVKAKEIRSKKDVEEEIKDIDTTGLF